MKTVKEYLSELDEDKLVDAYFRKRSEQLSDYYYRAVSDDDEHIKNMTLLEYAGEQIRLLHEYIEYLKTLDIAKSEDGMQGVIYAYKCLDGFYDLHERVCTELLKLEELIEDPEGCENYGYIFTEFSEILGFLVADNSYTQKNIYEVIADVLWDASYMGYRQEHLKEELDYLENAENDPGELHSYDSLEEIIADVFGEDELCEKDEEKRNESEELERLLDAARIAKDEYERASMLRERRILFEAVTSQRV